MAVLAGMGRSVRISAMSSPAAASFLIGCRLVVGGGGCSLECDEHDPIVDGKLQRAIVQRSADH
jgi:hypothetical protein